MRPSRRTLLPALAMAAGVLWSASPADAHPLSGGPATGLQIAVLVGGLVVGALGWIIVARGGARLSKPGYALLFLGLLAFLGGPDLAGSIADLRSGPLPTTRTRLDVLTPRDDDVIASPKLQVRVRLLEPDGSSGTGVTPLDPARGHIHVSIDGRVLSMAWEPVLALPVSVGRHAVTVEYVAGDHRPFSPRVLVTRRITVRPVGADRARAVAATGVVPPTLTWRDWSWDPTIVAGLAFTILAYRWVARRFPPRRWQPVFFWGGVLSLVLALLSPIDTGSEFLFTIHMVQHMLLLLVAAPLLALAVPPAFLGRLYQVPWAARVLHGLWSPFPSLLIFNGVLLFWHLPAAYDATLASRWIHAVEHLSFVGAGMIFWGVIVSPVPKLVRASYGLRLGLVIVADIVNFLLGFALAFAGQPFYRHYAEIPRLWGLAPLVDLRLGGGVMWVMGQMMYAVPVLLLLRVLLRREDAGGPRPGIAVAASNGSGR